MPFAGQAESTAVPDYVAAAVASPLRAPKDVARDPTQRPADVLAFAGVKPGDRVADFWPIPPYSTALLSALVGPEGHVYAVVPPKLFRDLPDAESRVKALLAPFENVTLLVQPFDAFRSPEPLDSVWLGKIYHDFPNTTEMGPLDIAAANRSFLDALKPGGVLIVIDHAADASSGVRDTEPGDAKRVHRIDPELVKTEVLAAGFEFAGASSVLANQADDHRKSSFDPAIRDHTDRFIFKFRRPLSARP
jgi:predicted methyltransferase